MSFRCLPRQATSPRHGYCWGKPQGLSYPARPDGQLRGYRHSHHGVVRRAATASGAAGRTLARKNPQCILHTRSHVSNPALQQRATHSRDEEKPSHLVNSQHGEASAIDHNDIAVLNARRASYGALAHFMLSEPNCASLDLSSIRAVLDTRECPPLLGSDPMPRLLHLARELDHKYRETDAVGLGGLAVALQKLSASLSDGQCFFFDAKHKMRMGKARIRCAVLNPASSPKTYIELGMALHVPQESLRGGMIKNLRIGLLLECDVEKTGGSLGKSFATKIDLEHLHETAVLVTERIATAMTFAEPRSFVSTVVASLLRILQFRTSFLNIVQIQAAARPSSSWERQLDTPIIKFRAKWDGPGNAVPPEGDRLTHNVIVTAADKQSTQAELDEEPAGDSKAADEANASPREPIPASATAKDEFTSSASTIPLWPVARDRSLDFLSPAMQSEALRACGFSRYQIEARWREEDKPYVQQLTYEAIARAGELALGRLEYGSLHALHEAAAVLQSSLPRSPRVDLTIFQNSANPGQVLNDGTENISYDRIAVRYVNRKLHQQGSFVYTVDGLYLSTKRVADLGMDGKLRACIRLRFYADPTAMLSKHMRTDAQFRQILTTIHEALATVLQRDTQSSLHEVAEEGAVALSQAVQSLGMISHFVDSRLRLSPVPQDGQSTSVRSASVRHGTKPKVAVIALGSNVGDGVRNIQSACQSIDADPDISILATSALYESKAMYVEDQAAFTNGTCKIRTTLLPFQLLNRLQAIESAAGRVKVIDKGPRNIDLDIATYSDREWIIDTDRLHIPHRLMLEREFVLRPFCDIAPDYRHPTTSKLLGDHLQELTNGKSSMFPITPLAPGAGPLRALEPTRRTQVMAILNVTPDSFSDGGSNEPSNLEGLRNTIAAQIAAGATIIDIGGQSSRPNAPDVTAEEEIARILPAIEVIKGMPEARDVTISIDTYRASVAAAAIEAGAHVVNDISAGQLDPEMLPTIARLGCTYVMMHMRGTPATMQNAENTSYSGDLVSIVANELEHRLTMAERAGIRRWRIILDPGIGFAKTVEQNAELVGRFAELRHYPTLKTYPWLVGTSRKGFIGELTGAADAKDRIEGTAATVTAAVAGGAEIVRVHDVKEMARVVKMADAMYRRSSSATAVTEHSIGTGERDSDGEEGRVDTEAEDDAVDEDPGKTA